MANALQQIYERQVAKGYDPKVVSFAIKKGYEATYTGETISGTYPSGFRETWLMVRENPEVIARAGTYFETIGIEPKKFAEEIKKPKIQRVFEQQIQTEIAERERAKQIAEQQELAEKQRLAEVTKPPTTPLTQYLPSEERGTLYEKQVETYTAPTGEQVPVTEVFYKTESGMERKATPEEAEYYRKEAPREVRAVGYSREEYEKRKLIIKPKEYVERKISEVKGAVVTYPLIEKPLTSAKKEIREADAYIKKTLTEPLFRDIQKVTGVDITSPEGREYFEKIIKTGPGPIPKFTAKPISSFTVGALKDVREEPFKQIVLYEAGKGIGILVGGAGETYRGYKAYLGITGKSKLGITGKSKVGKIVGDTVGVGISGLVGYQATKEILAAPTKEEKYAVAGVIAKDIALFGLGYKRGIISVTKPEIKVYRKEPITIVREEARVIKGAGRDIEAPEVYSVYRMKTTVYPPEVEITTPTRRKLELPKVMERTPIGKPKIYEDITPFPAKEGEPFTLGTITPRKKAISMIEGFELKRFEYAEMLELLKKPKEVKIEPLKKERKLEFLKPMEEFRTRQLLSKIEKIMGKIEEGKTSKLSEIDKRLIQEAVGFKYPVPEKKIPSLIKKDAQYIFSELEKTEFYKGARKTKLTTEEFFKGYKPYGKRTKKIREFSILEQIPTKEELPYELFEFKTTAKEISPYARATGRIGKLRGYLKYYGEPLTIAERKTIFEKTLFPKIIPKLEKIQISIPKSIKKQMTEPSVSKTELGVVPSTVKLTYPKTQVKSISREFVIPKTRKQAIPTIKQDIIIKTLPFQKELIKIKPMEKLMERQLEKQITKTMTKPLVKAAPKVKTRQKLRERVLQKLKVTTKIPTPYMPGVPQRPRIRIKPPTAPPVKFSLGPSKAKKISDLESFEVFTIRKRKPVVIAKGLTKRAALDIGASAVMKDLTATFGIRRGRAPVRKVLPTGTFRRFEKLFRKPRGKSPYKALGEVYVQKQSRVGMLGGRLAFKPERVAIQKARLNKLMNTIK